MGDKMRTIKTYILEITKTCNQNCMFCYSISCNPKNKAAKQLSGNEWKKALNNLIVNSAEAVDFSGGEPTFHPDYAKIIKHAKNLSLQVIVSTNGSTIGVNKIRQSIQRYADFVCLSLHGSNSAIHESVTGKKGSFTYAIKSLNTYYKNYRETGNSQLKINTVACALNLEDVVSIGETIKIEKRNIVWKVSQAIPREKGYQYKDKICVPDKKFEKLQEKIIARYPKAYASGRILFREDDTNKETFSPYLIAKNNGQLHYPKGEKHQELNVNILEDNLLSRVQEAYEKINSNDYQAFAEQLEVNHYVTYRKKSCASS